MGLDDREYVRDSKKTHLSDLYFNSETGELEHRDSPDKKSFDVNHFSRSFTFKNRKKPIIDSLEKIYKKSPNKNSDTYDRYRSRLSAPRPVPFWVYIVFFGIVAYFIKIFIFPTNIHLDASQPPVALSSPALDSVPSQSVPETSVFASSYPPSVAVSPFSFVVPPNSEHYFIKLKDATNGFCVLSAFVRSGDVFKTTIPVGSYHLYMSSGTNWIDESELFGLRTTYSVGAHSLFFSLRSGHTVFVQNASDSNFPNSSITKQDF